MSESIRFTADDYKRVAEDYEKWWKWELPRPIVGATVKNKSVRSAERQTYLDKCRKKPNLCFATAWDFSIPVTDFIDRADADLDNVDFYGDAFPLISTTAFGAGALAVTLGCGVESRPQTVWFYPPEKDVPLKEMHFEFNKENKYFRRIANLYEAAMDKWRGDVVIAMYDIGGVMDVLSSFRGVENLLIDCLEEEDEVVRCVKEIQKAWFDSFNALTDIIKGVHGYSDWWQNYCAEPTYILQSDFSYMISPDMFAKFVAPELDSSSKKLSHPFYHLDGIGELPHLPQVLAIDDIAGIQWVPGDGPYCNLDWSDIHKTILNAHKKVIYGIQKSDGTLRDYVGNGEGVFCGTRYFENLDDAKKYAYKLGLEL